MTVNIEELKALLGAVHDTSPGDIEFYHAANEALADALHNAARALIAAYEEREGLVRRLGELEADLRGPKASYRAGHCADELEAALAAQPQAVVPEGMRQHEGIGSDYEKGYITGWNECRAATLQAANPEERDNGR